MHSCEGIGAHHDYGDGDEDPVAGKTVSKGQRVWWLLETHNNWGSLWIVCTGTCAIFARYLIVAVGWCCRRPKPSCEVRDEAALLRRPLASSDGPESLEFKTRSPKVLLLPRLAHLATSTKERPPTPQSIYFHLRQTLEDIFKMAVSQERISVHSLAGTFLNSHSSIRELYIPPLENYLYYLIQTTS